MRAFYCLLIIVLLSCASLVVFAGTTGKLVGTVTDARTGDKLPSVNVVIEGTTLGAVTNVDGYFVILNVSPGRYRVKATLLGYSVEIADNVRIDIDQTTTQNFHLSEQTIAGEEVTVIAQRPVVQKDVSASRVNIEIQDVEKLPVTTVVQAVQLQAGIESGLVVRGGTIDQTMFLMDGVTLRDERTNNPYTGIALSSVKDIQVQTGGFNAEYGNLRSGVVNVITEEGSPSQYSFSITGRYAPTQPKHFGMSPYDANSYWIRPYVDPAVMWTGTDNGAWDSWTQLQYAPFPGGYNAISVASMKNPDPSKHLTPEAAHQLFLWEHRRQAEINNPDWDVDMGFGGPVPFAQELGNLRFFASYRQSTSEYLVPLSVDAYKDYNGQLKLTTDVSSTLKLTGSLLLGRQTGTNNNNSGLPGMFVTPGDIANAVSYSPLGAGSTTYLDTRVFATDYWCPTTTWFTVGAVRASHVLSSSTFYDATLSYTRSRYQTDPGALRNTAAVYQFGNYFADEAPFGFAPIPNPPSSLVSTLRFGLGFSDSRDSSLVQTYSFKGDLTSQVDKYNQIKTGIELAYTDNYGDYANHDAGLPRSDTWSSWHTFPIRGAVYVQDKLEFEGMIANLGVRVDYLNPNGKWYDVTNPYSAAFSGAGAPGIDTTFPMKRTPAITTISPRLGIAFPISEDSKLYFNYGHFNQVPAPENLFLLRKNGFDNSIARIANPSAPFPKTVAYELGYEQSLFDEYLLRVAGYYKDITNESFLVNYVSRDNLEDYYVYTSNRYRDIRGFEITATKNRGSWVQGFINYTYDVASTGYFGAALQYQSAQAQAEYVAQNVYQTKPVPQPYARMNVDVFTPRDFGPDFAGFKILSDWRLNLLGSWQNGTYFTWVGGGSKPGIANNVQWRDSWSLNMRLSKTFEIGHLSLQLFADVSNLLNLKQMSSYGFSDVNDYYSYMKSLHLSGDLQSDLGYINVPGSDRPGDYRLHGAAFQPVVAVATMADLNTSQNQQARPFYWVQASGQYYQWVNNAWQQVDQGRLQQVLDNKAYIDMPNMETYTFLNPRQIFWGLRLGFDF